MAIATYSTTNAGAVCSGKASMPSALTDQRAQYQRERERARGLRFGGRRQQREPPGQIPRPRRGAADRRRDQDDPEVAHDVLPPGAPQQDHSQRRRDRERDDRAPTRVPRAPTGTICATVHPSAVAGVMASRTLAGVEKTELEIQPNPSPLTTLIATTTATARSTPRTARPPIRVGHQDERNGRRGRQLDRRRQRAQRDAQQHPSLDGESDAGDHQTNHQEVVVRRGHQLEQHERAEQHPAMSRVPARRPASGPAAARTPRAATRPTSSSARISSTPGHQARAGERAHDPQEQRAVGRGGVAPERRHRAQHVRLAVLGEDRRRVPIRIQPEVREGSLGQVAVGVLAEQRRGHGQRRAPQPPR